MDKHEQHLENVRYHLGEILAATQALEDEVSYGVNYRGVTPENPRLALSLEMLIGRLRALITQARGVKQRNLLDQTLDDLRLMVASIEAQTGGGT